MKGSFTLLTGQLRLGLSSQMLKNKDAMLPDFKLHFKATVRQYIGLVARLHQTLMTPWTVAHWAHLSMGFTRQEYCSGLPIPSPGKSSQPRIKPGSPALQADSFPLSHCGSPRTAFIADPDSMTRAPTRGENSDANEQENILWKKEAEFRGMCLPGRSRPGLLGSTEPRRQERRIPRNLGERMALLHLDFRFLASGTMRGNISVVPSHSVCGSLLCQL